MSNNTIPRVELVSADPLQDLVYQTRNKCFFRLVRETHRLVLRKIPENTMKGTIVPGSNWSGVIWVVSEASSQDLQARVESGEIASEFSQSDIEEASLQCIGGYERQKKRYTVIPYKDGHKKLKEREGVHPLDYLLRFIE